MSVEKRQPPPRVPQVLPSLRRCCMRIRMYIHGPALHMSAWLGLKVHTCTLVVFKYNRQWNCCHLLRCASDGIGFIDIHESMESSIWYYLSTVNCLLAIVSTADETANMKRRISLSLSLDNKGTHRKAPSTDAATQTRQPSQPAYNTTASPNPRIHPSSGTTADA